MLDTTLTTDFVPGTNIKGEVAGANWAFLLPSLELDCIACVGALSDARLLTLARLAAELVVICESEQGVLAIEQRAQRHGLSNVRAIGLGGLGALADHSVALALLAGGRAAARLGRDQTLQSALRRTLKPDGLLYFEQRGGQPQRLSRTAALCGAPQLYWLTPSRGEMHTAVPLQDQATTQYFLQHGLTSRSLDLGALKRATRSALGSGPASAAVRPAAGGGSHSLKSRLKRAARATVARLLLQTQSALDGAEQWLQRQERLGRLTRRYGVLVGPSAPSAQPPAYLQRIAAEAGLPIDAYRWGLAARGEYRSRKVLFFLFARAGEAPTYIVKMTRDPALNGRLENEAQALSALAARGIGDRETLPQVVFQGHHNQLAIVGETIVDGKPFEQRSSGTTDCRFARAAIDWLTTLGTSTADARAATPFQAAEALGMLFERFTQIYRLSATEQSFLEQQIASIGQSRQPFPLVFQHGDPGTWNIMVTPADRVAFLDWEAAEPLGMPLWDLFYFIRTYAAWSTRASSAGDTMKGFASQFLSASPFQALLHEATQRYCQRVGVPEELIEPLFYTCWMHRALKEATRLPVERVDQGHYVSLLRASIQRRSALAPCFVLQSEP